jgi:hypothetical protein
MPCTPREDARPTPELPAISQRANAHRATALTTACADPVC